MNLDIGSTVGDYQIIGILGEGGMGKVYKVRNTISDRVEAMKILLPNLTGEPELADRFLREIKVQASLDHPNIAALRTAVRFENQLLMIMELVEGVTLEQRLRSGRISVTDATGYIDQVLAALSYAHGRGVIHRDIKPANMMLTPNGTVKLMDFGIAKGATDRKLTMTGTTMGSLYYMSPEQIRGALDLDARADLYSLGVSLYELVTGKKPFDGDSQFAIMSAHLEKAPEPPVSIDPTLPAALNDVILLSVQKDPNNRFQTADAFRNALRSVIQIDPPAIPAPDLVPHLIQPTPPSPPGSRRGLWMAAGAVCAVLAVVGIVQFGPWQKTSAVGKPQTQPPAVSQPVANSQPTQVSPPASAPAASPAPNPTEPTSISKGFVPDPVRTSQPKPSVQVAQRPAPGQMPQSQVSTTPAPVAQTPAPTPQAPATQAPAPPAPDAAAKRAELMQLRESLAMVSARAGSIRSTLQSLQAHQASSGLGLRGDWLESATLMETFLKGTSAALDAGDAPAAKGFLDKAERQVEKLEKALNK
jgi:eukaryotic-like serine/threonine-protein kinase